MRGVAINECPPIACSSSGPTWVGWALSSRLSGGAAWGRPRLPDVEQIARDHARLLSAGHAGGLEVVLDLSRLEHISPEVFTCYARLVVPLLPEFARLIRRQALIVPEGLVGSVVAGFFELYRGLGPSQRLFRAAPEAFAWLGCDEPTAARVSALVNVHRQTPTLLHGLRAVLADEPGVDIEGAARALMTSARSLQRALREAGTSFRAEQSTARLEAARELLRGEPMKVGCVARALGMASTSHFVAWFRRETGATPARWRIGEAAVSA